MSENPTLPVELTLEESGTLCHLLLPAIQDLDRIASTNQVSMVATPKVARAVARRMLVLYAKLSSCNDKLMGKK